MPRVGLDEKDRIILSALKKNSRISNSDLAKLAGLAATPCKERVKRLQNIGIIKKFTIEVGSEAEVFSTKYMLIEVSKTNERMMTSVENVLISHPSVSMIFLIEGGWDYLVKIDETGAGMARNIINDLMQLDGIGDTMTFTVVECVWNKDLNLRNV